MLDLEKETSISKLVWATKSTMFSKEYKESAKKRLKWIRNFKKSNYYPSINLNKLGYRGYNGDIEGVPEPSSVIFTTKEFRHLQSLDVWKLKVNIQHCPLCGGKYIPTPQSDKTCIPCNYK